ncbi:MULTISPECIES: NAD(P)-dependent oxidoreductase [unclassified Beijerinckia]|uniref:NAD(P)-dependent oxidoreductase n=1 Tax=unclassified Beijerinckia TaxID=2638183 RepID=UPI000898CA0F|nr:MULTISPECIES: NAD(P)-dependent oxidoreductase [unclassified Beijerinckia]MDH7794382.1 3-hydroxyisobutyrate dehydrogenase [Beijerinckia sp. GAS462]SEB60543.1 3-hydroxyisobutyrate dehydrogenase [Beijerinckia sp. 28-YEA-48]
MIASKDRLGWIGMGRMGTPMAELLLKAGHDVQLWNRTKAKAEPLAAKGAKLVDRPIDLSGTDILFTMVSTGKDLEQVYFGEGGVATRGKNALPKIFVDCSSIGVEDSAKISARLGEMGAQFLAVPVSGNGKCVKAGKLSAVASGPRAAFDAAKPYIEAFARSGLSYVGEGELARICKIAHNVMLGVVIQNLAEITILAQKHGVPRHAFLDFMNNSVMGSTFTRYKSNALVNLDWTTTFTMELLRKDMDLGLTAARKYDVPMPVTAATREAIQSHFGVATLKADPKAYLDMDFATLLETQALASGVSLKSEGVPVPTGLEVDH